MAADSNSQHHPEFYFASYPFLESPELKLAAREFADIRRKRYQIFDLLKAKKGELQEVREKLKPLSAEEKTLKDRGEEIHKRLLELGFNFNNVRGENSNQLLSSEAEIDREMRNLESQFMEVGSTREQNHLLKQIKDLQRSRGQVLSIEDWNLNRRLKDISNEKKDRLRDIKSRISALQKDGHSYNQYMNQAYRYLHQLRYQNNELCLQMRAERDDAIFNYRANPNPSALEHRSRLEVEKFMRRWNENSEFREDYQHRMSTAGNVQYPRLSTAGNVQYPRLSTAGNVQYPRNSVAAEYPRAQCYRFTNG